MMFESLFLYDMMIRVKKYIARKPKQVTINKPAVVVFWEDGTKTVVKCSDDDEFNPTFGFLMAYYKKNIGLSSTQASKLLHSLVKED